MLQGRSACLSSRRLSHWCFWWKMSWEPVSGGSQIESDLWRWWGEDATIKRTRWRPAHQLRGASEKRVHGGQSVLWVLKSQCFVRGENTVQGKGLETRRFCVLSPQLGNWMRYLTALSLCFLICNMRTVIFAPPPRALLWRDMRWWRESSWHPGSLPHFLPVKQSLVSLPTNSGKMKNCGKGSKYQTQ